MQKPEIRSFPAYKPCLRKSSQVVINHTWTIFVLRWSTRQHGVEPCKMRARNAMRATSLGMRRISISKQEWQGGGEGPKDGGTRRFLARSCRNKRHCYCRVHVTTNQITLFTRFPFHQTSIRWWFMEMMDGARTICVQTSILMQWKREEDDALKNSTNVSLYTQYSLPQIYCTVHLGGGRSGGIIPKTFPVSLNQLVNQPLRNLRNLLRTLQKICWSLYKNPPSSFCEKI